MTLSETGTGPWVDVALDGTDPGPLIFFQIIEGGYYNQLLMIVVV